ncbi:DEAD/DEAH box helicase [Halobacterium bonnevillei]|uniref:Putative DNA 3'-5' helicase Rad25 n=1 Tax=Halobacterium bonnevillei TaxID=2692200 RepID=A0A6B0STC8_9EURY|nr:DEAD/DEAH box helicase [Halobacterium bonnevillei]MXR20829.1 DEAD/DEAH box helicase family protein [Halobacterium bonnevillei]
MTDISKEAFHDALEAVGRPVATAEQVARELDTTQAEAAEALAELAEAGDVERADVENDPVVWYPRDWLELTDRERVVPFPDRREIVVDQPSQFTRAQLSRFAHLADTTRTGSYRYVVREEDVWAAPFESLADLLDAMDRVLPRDCPGLKDWVEEQWTRATRFRLVTHDDGYVVLEAKSESLLGNVADQHLADDVLRAPISDTEAWVAEDKVAELKRTLYEAGYPVQDDRDLETGEPLEVDLGLELRDYQQDWVKRFVDASSGVLVGPPGSGKTVAAMGVLEAVGGETLVLVPSRELAAQWRDELLGKTSLKRDQIGEYHGGEKNLRPVTIATYQTAGMDRHRHVFDDREWGLIVYDEAHHIPSEVFRRSAALQSKHRLGLSATPVREDDKEMDIYTLIGPPIGTDWDALFEAGYVAEPTVEIRYVPWADDDARYEYSAESGHARRRLAAENPAKDDEVAHLLGQHADKQALVFVDYLEQGRRLADAIDAPFVSGETRHVERESLFDQFRTGALDTLVVSRIGDEGIDLPDAELAIVASGLGGSRRQGAQRAGRTMRPGGQSLLFVLATRGTGEEDDARSRMRHLAAKGVRVTESGRERA